MARKKGNSPSSFMTSSSPTTTQTTNRNSSEDQEGLDSGRSNHPQQQQQKKIEISPIEIKPQGIHTNTSEEPETNVNKNVLSGSSSDQKRTSVTPVIVSVEDFFKERPSLLTIEDDQDDEETSDSEQDIVNIQKKQESKKKVSFDGFLNLGLIFLTAMTLRVMIDNVTERGLLIPNFALLFCISDELIKRSFVDVLVFTVTYNCALYLNSCIGMYIVERFRGKKSENTILATLLKVLEKLIYYVLSFAYIGLFVMTIFLKRLSLMVNLVMVFTMMIYVMKGFSYYQYTKRRIFTTEPLKVNPDSDDERNIHLPTTPISFWREYCYFLFVPTLCFFRNYPMSKTIRISFIVKQCVYLLLCGAVAWVIFIQYLEPIFRSSATLNIQPPSIEFISKLFEQNGTSPSQQVFNIFKQQSPVAPSNYLSNLGKFCYLMLKVSFPWFLTWLIISFAFFHCYLNILAEVTRFGDRRFFLDWWNCQDFQSFWKNWNLPVHQWLLRHIYFKSLGSGGSKPISVFFTFLTSAILHELCMALIFRSIKFYFFAAMLVQVPFVLLGQYLNHKRKSKLEESQPSSPMSSTSSTTTLSDNVTQSSTSSLEVKKENTDHHPSPRKSLREIEKKLLELKQSFQKKLKSRRGKELLQRLGNISMWLSLFAGQPLLCLLYFHDWYTFESMICDVKNSKYGYNLMFDRWSDSFSFNASTNFLPNVFGNQLVSGEWRLMMEHLLSYATGAFRSCSATVVHH
ncbi:hypothetical protein C9374_011664 [Naegleria lovaniensis]|uniref:O-acyltransferase n=1 Tax=Naegleria lovaniensis TaxID=51637 RepID=A0AA88KEV3_NAELO|nr:uncharacterized protein C9374_011664 [Naegleria lovaniensis]KAG2373999.1 hypothetical protein C9374_011664 [Naegleria lovaniensis]